MEPTIASWGMFHQPVMEFLTQVFGLGIDSTDLTVWHVLARGLVIYVVGVAVVRLGKGRFLGRNTVFDLLLVLILGSCLSRSINGSAPFFETIALAIGLVALHAGFAMAAFHTDNGFGKLIKGRAPTLVRDGKIDEEAMRDSYVTRRDLEEALRQHGYPPEVDQIRMAHMERNGEISVVPRAGIHDIAVADGVKTVRIVVE